MNFCSLIPKFTTQVLSHPHWKQECLVIDCECVTNVHALMSARQDWGPSSTKDQLVSQVEKLLPVASQVIQSPEGMWLTIQKTPGTEGIECCKSSPLYGLCQVRYRPPIAGLHHGHQVSGAKTFIPPSFGVWASMHKEFRLGDWAPTGQLYLEHYLHGELPGDRWHSVPWSSSHLGIVTPRS